jgi:tetratricopeptide (TPR) repeat protein
MSQSDQESAESINALEELPKGTHAVFMGLAAIAVLGMMGFVLGYGVYGKVVTADLDDACARSAFLNGQKFQELGNYDRAILRYRQAMKGHFNDPEDRHRCGRAIGDLLFEQGRFPEAITAYRSLPEAAFGHAGAYTAFVTSLWRDNQLEEAEVLGRRWLTLAEQENSDEQILWSNNVLFRVAHTKGRYEEAMELGAAMVKIDPATDARLVLAQMLHEQGKDAEAVREIDQFMEKTEKTRLYQQARAMKRDIEANIQ